MPSRKTKPKKSTSRKSSSRRVLSRQSSKRQPSVPLMLAIGLVLGGLLLYGLTRQLRTPEIYQTSTENCSPGYLGGQDGDKPGCFYLQQLVNGCCITTVAYRADKAKPGFPAACLSVCGGSSLSTCARLHEKCGDRAGGKSCCGDYCNDGHCLNSQTGQPCLNCTQYLKSTFRGCPRDKIFECGSVIVGGKEFVSCCSGGEG